MVKVQVLLMQPLPATQVPRPSLPLCGLGACRESIMRRAATFNGCVLGLYWLDFLRSWLARRRSIPLTCAVVHTTPHQCVSASL